MCLSTEQTTTFILNKLFNRLCRIDTAISERKGSKSYLLTPVSNASSILLHFSRLNYVNELRLEKVTREKPSAKRGKSGWGSGKECAGGVHKHINNIVNLPLKKLHQP